MPKRIVPFADTLRAAARLVPKLLDGDGEPVISRVAAYCAEKGHPVSQPTLQRHYKPSQTKPRALDDPTAKALEHVFRIPARIWKGEPVTEDEARAITQFGYQTILLAQKIEALPPRIREALLIQIENAHANQEEMQRLLAGSNVTPIERGKR